MKVLKTKIPKVSKNYLKIETSGLSKEKDTIITIGIIEKDSKELKNFYIENLKDEEKLLEYTIPLIENKEFVTFSGKNFDLPFLNSKSKFYFDREINTQFIDLQEVSKKYNYLFNLSSHSNKSLLDYFLKESIEENNYKGIKIKNLFKNFVEGKETSLLKIVDYNISNLKNLILLDSKINSELEKNLSLKVFDCKFLIKKMNLIENTLEIQGVTNYDKKYFSTNNLYTLNIDKIFNIKINTEDALYDNKNKCFYTLKKDFPFILENASKIESPSQILILYYKNHLFENEKYLIQKILEFELKNL
ncbi:ribonuclease H-like domain-containing protein [Peptoniphilus rhinitidis]|jgi:hypothetical protein|uniref:ribonuclease H-like domain-containing protein n=1 Tax=Peptoniphilus rhinitidis TaxID=1175452 RepID=UPI00290FE38B|nr:ribonuclease H-like domain-containing protein [Peptoniphilus rhinitidis]MDU5595589.1 ribonuclease H-like domain-containing protein [Peptoniphilus rhinitidis]